MWLNQSQFAKEARAAMMIKDTVIAKKAMMIEDEGNGQGVKWFCCVIIL